MRSIIFTVLVLGMLGASMMVFSMSAAEPTGTSRLDASQGSLAQSGSPEEQAERHFLRGEYEDAARAYRSVVQRDPDNGLAWVRLAYASHELGEFEESATLHEKAAEFNENRIASLYKLGCALARLGRFDESIDALERSVEAGYRDRNRAELEADLESVRGEARFQRVLDRMGPPPIGQSPLDFLVGHWVVRKLDGIKTNGFLTIQRVDQSHIYQEQWNFFEGGSGRAITFLDPAAGTYESVRVEVRGEVHRLRGRYQDGALRLDGERVLQTGQSMPLKAVIEPQKDGRILRTFLVSEDGGAHWEPLSESIMVPEEPVWSIRRGR